MIRAVNWLGDAVMTTPALGVIRKSFPAARLTILANPVVAEMFSPHVWIDEVIVYDKKGIHAGFSGKLMLAAELKARHFDLAILLQNAFDAALITWLARIPLRIGYQSDGRGLLLTEAAVLTTASKSLHHVDYYLAMLEFFGIKDSDRKLSLTVTTQEDEAAAALLAEAGVGKDDFLLGINPGASYGAAKRWYPERFAEVAKTLSSRWGAKVLVTGGGGEKAIAADIASLLEGRCLNMAGKTDVRMLMALLKRCDFLVTNDSGPMHIAAAFGVPLVAIFGPTDHMTTSPLSESAVVVRKETECAPCLLRECPTDHICMTAVMAEDVVSAALEVRQKFSRGQKT